MHKLREFGDPTRPPTGVHVYEAVEVTAVEVKVAELFTRIIEHTTCKAPNL